MQHKRLRFGRGFHVLCGDAHSQAAQMVLTPGQVEGGPDNRHRGADQWLYVVSGNGQTTVAGKSISLRQGSLLLIERGETHEIRNTGKTALRTLNIYVPPAYSGECEELLRGRS